MPRLTKERIAQAYNEGYALGRLRGEAESEADTNLEMKRQQAALALTHAVGQAMQQQSQLLEGLWHCINAIQGKK